MAWAHICQSPGTYVSRYLCYVDAGALYVPVLCKHAIFGMGSICLQYEHMRRTGTKETSALEHIRSWTDTCFGLPQGARVDKLKVYDILNWTSIQAIDRLCLWVTTSWQMVLSTSSFSNSLPIPYFNPLPIPVAHISLAIPALLPPTIYYSGFL